MRFGTGLRGGIAAAAAACWCFPVLLSLCCCCCTDVLLLRYCRFAVVMLSVLYQHPTKKMVLAPRLPSSSRGNEPTRKLPAPSLLLYRSAVMISPHHHHHHSSGLSTDTAPRILSRKLLCCVSHPLEPPNKQTNKQTTTQDRQLTSSGWTLLKTLLLLGPGRCGVWPLGVYNHTQAC